MNGIRSIELIPLAAIFSAKFFPAQLLDEPLVPEKPDLLHKPRIVCSTNNPQHSKASACT